MPITVKNLLARVAPFRPDLKDEMALFGIREAVRKIAQDSTVIKKFVFGNHTTNGSRSAELAGLDENLNRIENISYYKLPDGATFAGTWNASTNAPELPAPRNTDSGSDSIVDGAVAPETLAYPMTYRIDDYRTIVSGKPTGSGATAKTPFYIFDSRTGWSSKIADVNGYRFYLVNDLVQTRTSPIMEDGRVWIVGGMDANDAYILKSYFLGADGTVEAGPDMPSASSGFGAQPLQQYVSKLYKVSDGTMLLYMQTNYSATAPNRFFKLNANGSIGASSPSTLGNDCISLNSICCVASNDKILICPGGASATPQKWSMYDYTTDTWSLTAQSSYTRYTVGSSGLGRDLGMISIGDGKILVCGGTNTTDGKKIEIYDTVANTWTLVCDAFSATAAAYSCMFNKLPETTARYLLTMNYNNSSMKAFVVDIEAKTSTEISFPSTVSREDGYTAFYDGNIVGIIGGETATTSLQYFDPIKSANTGWYYGVEVGGNGYEAGDIVYSDGTTWTRYSKYSFKPIPQYNVQTMNNKFWTDDSVGEPTMWAQTNSTITLYPTPDNEYPLNVEVSYSPIYLNLDDEVGIPVDFEQVIVDGALAYLYAMPGEGMDKNMAMNYRRIFERGVNNAKCVGIFGFGGSPTYTAPFFAGTGGIR